MSKIETLRRLHAEYEAAWAAWHRDPRSDSATRRRQEAAGEIQVMAVVHLPALLDTVEALREAERALTAIDEGRGPPHPLTPASERCRQDAAIAELRRVIDRARRTLAALEET